jgi:hypothetical protein
MANPLTTSSQITCPHTGKVTPASSAKLTIAGEPVLLSNQWSAWAIVGCKQVPPPQGNKPCLKVINLADGEANKLSVGGVPVLIDSGQGTSDGAPAPGPVTLSAGETKVQAP